MSDRRSGILMHITSLPSKYGIGDLGPAAYSFVDFLALAKQKLWQILPISPTELGSCNSPYSSFSAFAGNTLLISPQKLVDDGILDDSIDNDSSLSSRGVVDYDAVVRHRKNMLEKFYKNFKKNKKHDYEFEKFCKEQSWWLDDYALFIALKEHFKTPDWSKWSTELRDRDCQALKKIAAQYSDLIEKEKLLQYVFFKQWFELKKYCNAKGVDIIGDMPIYVDYCSVDVWANQDCFKLAKNKKSLYVGGVPPDYFSETGQRWGNPVYRWDVIKKDGFSWWLKRVKHYQTLFDIIRIDHFRGLVAYWEIPASEKTAINGKWIPAPADNFFKTLTDSFPNFPIIAEDLGIITPDVKEVMKKFNFPGMRLLIFAFGEDSTTHPYLPCNYICNCIAMTGTHDTNTIIGWYKSEAGQKEKIRLMTYLKTDIVPKDLHWKLIDLIVNSKANTTIFPMQDILGLDETARMNTPSVKDGNWKWRLMGDELTPDLSERLRQVTLRSKRA